MLPRLYSKQKTMENETNEQQTAEENLNDIFAKQKQENTEDKIKELIE